MNYFTNSITVSSDRAIYTPSSFTRSSVSPGDRYFTGFGTSYIFKIETGFLSITYRSFWRRGIAI